MLILNDEDKEKLKKITKRNGSAFIRDKAIQEAKEFIVALERNVEEEMVDEVADILIMAVELIDSHDITEQVKKRITFKLDRTVGVLKI